MREHFDEELVVKQCGEIAFFSGVEESNAIKELVVQKAIEFSKEKMVCVDRLADLNAQVIKQLKAVVDVRMKM